MGTYRYHTGRALRQRGQPFNQYDGKELRSEDFDSFEEFFEQAVACEMEHVMDDQEIEEEKDDGTN